jgi:hypothetical protein
LREVECQTENVPSLDGQLLTETLIAFLMIGLLGFVLRWTFSRDQGTPPWPPSDPEDFGLLAPVATVDNADEAARVRAMLADAGIKATTAAGTDGRHRVLVFSTELDRARRVTGWSA